MNPAAFKVFLQMFLLSLPAIIVCLGACIVILGKWKSNSSWPLWALLGFGLAMFIGIAAPFTQALAQSWVLQGGNTASPVWIYSMLAGFWSVLRACAYILLFVAVLEGRQ
jgi:hypothetical protein